MKIDIFANKFAQISNFEEREADLKIPFPALFND